MKMNGWIIEWKNVNKWINDDDWMNKWMNGDEWRKADEWMKWRNLSVNEMELMNEGIKMNGWII